MWTLVSVYMFWYAITRIPTLMFALIVLTVNRWRYDNRYKLFAVAMMPIAGEILYYNIIVKY